MRTGSTTFEKAIMPRLKEMDVLATEDILQELRDIKNSHIPSDLKDNLKLINPLKHVRPEYVKDKIAEDTWNGYFKFAFVRNPWDWVLSMFHHIFASKKYKMNNIFDFLKALYYEDFGLRDEEKFTARDVNKVWNKMKINRGYFAEENYFQSQFIQSNDGRQMLDFIGKYETLNADFKYICEEIKFDFFSLPRLNNSINKLNYRDIYTEEAKKLVADRYAKDIKLLGYKFDD